MIRDSYETSHGIFDHTSPQGDDPMALVRMHWSEDMVTNGRLHIWLKKFAELRIGSIFNISFDDFLEQEKYICELMVEIAGDKNVQTNQANAELLNSLTGNK